MPDLPESGIRLVAETDDFNRGMRDALDVGLEFDSLASDVISNVDEMASAFDSFDPSIEIPDAELPFDQIPEEINTEIHAEPDEESSGTFDLLKGMAAGVIVFQAVINVVGTILDVLSAIEGITLAPILDVEDAMARFTAQTGQSNEGLEDIINRLHFISDVGEGFDDITNTLITANRLGITSFEDMEEAALGALQTAKSQGVDAVQTLRTMQILVDQGLAEGFTEAADLVTVAIQNGNDRAGDLFATINQFGPMFAEMGLDGSEAMSLINSGLDAGFRSASDVARAIDTMNKNIVGAEPGSAIDDALSSIGVDLPEQGEQVGEEFFNSVIEGIQANPEAADAAIEAIFGGRADKVSEAFGELTLSDEAFDELEGRAEEAATAIDDSLRGALADFQLWIESEISEFLNSTTIDIPGKLRDLKERLQAALGALGEGESIGMALELAFESPGLKDSIERLESAIGQFVIEFSLGISSILRAFGNTDAANQVQTFAQGLATEQMEFDLRIADNGEQLAQAVQDALRRGVDTQSIYESAAQVVNRAMEEGNTDLAANIANTFEREFRDSPVAFMFDGLAEQVNDEIADIQEAAALAAAQTTRIPQELQYQMTTGGDGNAPAVPPAIAPAVQADMDAVTAATEEAANSLIIHSEQMGTAIQEADGVIHQAVIGGSIVPDIRLIATTAISAFPQVIAPAMLMATSVQLASSMVSAGLMNIRNTASVAMPAAAGFVNNLTQEIYGLGDTAPVLDSIISKLSQLASVGTRAREVLNSVAAAGREAASVVNNVTNNTNVNVNNNVQSSAQANNVAQQTASAVRGF